MTAIGLWAQAALGADVDAWGALLRGGLSATVVAGLLLAVRHLGHGIGGLLAGLPTVTGPAVVWLALDRGDDFATLAAHGAVAAAAPCALFALVYAGLAARHGRALALLCAGSVSLLSLPALALPALPQWHRPVAVTLLVVALVCVGCLALIPGGSRQPARRAPAGAADAPAKGFSPVRTAVITVLVTAVMSTLSSLLARPIGAYWAGVLCSMPLLAAAVALALHRPGGMLQVRDFLRGYTAGLVGRSVFVALFGMLLKPQGLAVALPAALATTLLMSWLSLSWLRWHSRLAALAGAGLSALRVGRPGSQ